MGHHPLPQRRSTHTHSRVNAQAKITAVVEAELLGSNLRLLVEMPNSGLVAMLQHDKVGVL